MLSNEQRKFLRGLAHDRKPVVLIGQHGLTENVLAEITTALDHHELIKIKLRGGNRQSRDEAMKKICAETQAEPVQMIGNVLTLYKRNKENPGIQLPK